MTANRIAPTILNWGNDVLINLEKPSASPGDSDERLVLSRCSRVGLCVMSLIAFAKDEIIDHFSGEVGPVLCQHSLQVRPGLHISGTRFVGYLSHGCAPNCRLDMEHFNLVALHDIGPGKLLTVDYTATEDVLFHQFACSCEAPDCRRWICGRIETVNVEGRRLLANAQASEL